MLQVISRFERGFGSRNYHFTIQEVEFVVVDAQTLDGTHTTFSFSSGIPSTLTPIPLDPWCFDVYEYLIFSFRVDCIYVACTGPQ